MRDSNNSISHYYAFYRTDRTTKTERQGQTGFNQPLYFSRRHTFQKVYLKESQTYYKTNVTDLFSKLQLNSINYFFKIFEKAAGNII